MDNTLEQLVGLEKTVKKWKAFLTKDTWFGIHFGLRIQEQRGSLPIFKFRSGIVEAVRNNQLLVIYCWRDWE